MQHGDFVCFVWCVLNQLSVDVRTHYPVIHEEPLSKLFPLVVLNTSRILETAISQIDLGIRTKFKYHVLSKFKIHVLWCLLLCGGVPIVVS